MGGANRLFMEVGQTAGPGPLDRKIGAIAASASARAIADARAVTLDVGDEGILIDGANGLTRIDWSSVRSLRLGVMARSWAFLFPADLGSPTPVVEIIIEDSPKLKFMISGGGDDDYLRFVSELVRAMRRATSSASIRLANDRLYFVARGGLCIFVTGVFAGAALIAALSGSLGGALLAGCPAAFFGRMTWLFIRDGQARSIAGTDEVPTIVERVRARLG